MTQVQRRKYKRTGQRRNVSYRKETPSENGKDLFLFRLYVVMILGGAVTLLSFFHTQTSQHFIEQVKESIAYQVSVEEIQEKKEWLAAFLEKNQISLPAFSKKEEERQFVPETEGMP